jgi:SAM-dependent methyltransferase
MWTIESAARVSQQDLSDNYVFQRSLLAYHFAAGIVRGNLLEIGTGNGYGVSIVAPKVESFITVDKKEPHTSLWKEGNVEFHRMKVPPLRRIASSSFDYVICFQVIEHIGRDFLLLEEIYRVLRPGGSLIISTPNIEKTIVCNPWHLREYTVDEFSNLLESYFSHVEPMGVFGNEKVFGYYEKNRQSVKRILRYDILRLHKILPRWMLRIPFDAGNRLNRRILLAKNREMTMGITMQDYYIEKANDECFDLMFVATK